MSSAAQLCCSSCSISVTISILYTRLMIELWSWWQISSATTVSWHSVFHLRNDTTCLCITDVVTLVMISQCNRFCWRVLFNFCQDINSITMTDGGILVLVRPFGTEKWRKRRITSQSTRNDGIFRPLFKTTYVPYACYTVESVNRTATWP